MVFNKNPHCRCGICRKPVEVGARVVWAGKTVGDAHYECRFPAAAARQEDKSRQGVLF